MTTDADDRPAPTGPLDSVEIRRVGPSYVVRVQNTTLTFRDVRADRELSADVSIAVDGVHVLRTTSALSLTGRNNLARAAFWMVDAHDEAGWRIIIYAAAEAVLVAEEQLGGVVDLRFASVTLDRPMFIVDPLLIEGPTALVAPGESGKSTIARAMAYSIGTGLEVIPGFRPCVTGPVLYIAAEDPVVLQHARSLEAIARGAGMPRASAQHAIDLLDVRGRKITRIGRMLAERADDYVAAIIDSVQALLPSVSDYGGGIRDRDSGFYDAIDAIRRATLLVAHPALNGARDWEKADGRIAGSEVNRDRLRMAWRATYRDQANPVYGTSVRDFTLTNTKWNHGPRFAPIGIVQTWQHGINGDPGIVTFRSGKATTTATTTRLTEDQKRLIALWESGVRSRAAFAEELGITPEAAHQRILRARKDGLIRANDDEDDEG